MTNKQQNLLAAESVLKDEDMPRLVGTAEYRMLNGQWVERAKRDRKYSSYSLPDKRKRDRRINKEINDA